MPRLDRISGRSHLATDLATDDLVARARRGDRIAFASLVESRLDRVFRTASAMLNNEADARDVVQEAFLATWQQLPKLREASAFDAWLNQVIRNRCRDVLRRRRRSREIDLGQFDRATPDTTAPIADTAALNAAFDRLNAEQRMILVLHHLHRLGVAELASQLGIPVGTAKWRLHAARQALERAMEAEA
jgi:RNA polymerase sigma-70 factor, ECF subfamily